MKLDLLLLDYDLKEMPRMARQAEAVGIDTLLMGEAICEPDYPLLLAAEHTSTLRLGTAVSVAFARSPMITAYNAWNMQAHSDGRYMLGLGSQVRSHIERRFSAQWDSPGPRMREVVLALRAIWRTWQTGEKLDFRGRFYSFTLMLPVHRPKPIAHPHIPVLLAAVNPYMCRIAGEVADGVHLHPFHSLKYWREVAFPSIDAGLAASGRLRSDLELVTPVFTITGKTSAEIALAREEIRRQIAFYATTPSYKLVFEIHGWAEAIDRIRALIASGKMDELPAVVGDEMLEAFAVEAPLDKIAQRIRERYEGIVHGVYFYPNLPRPLGDEAFWQQAVGILHE